MNTNTVAGTSQYVQCKGMRVLFADEQYLSVPIGVSAWNQNALCMTVSVQQDTLVKKQLPATHKAINHLL